MHHQQVFCLVVSKMLLFASSQKAHQISEQGNFIALTGYTGADVFLETGAFLTLPSTYA